MLPGVVLPVCSLSHVRSSLPLLEHKNCAGIQYSRDTVFSVTPVCVAIPLVISLLFS